MKEKTKTQFKKRVHKTERHIRWNWERSPDNPDLVRYHFIVVDDKNRDGIMAKVLEQLTSNPFSSSLELIRKREYCVANSRLKVLFESWDSYVNPRTLIFKLDKLSRPVKKDLELRERVRKGYSIEKYVERIYSY